MGLNRGEWSEFLAVLNLLENPNIKIVDSNLNMISEEIFILKNIRLYTPLNVYTLSRNDNKIEVFSNDILKYSITIKEISYHKECLLQKIKHNISRNGVFNIPEVHDLIFKLNESNVIKSKSNSKSDLDTDMKDNIKNQLVNLKYSIKSQIGSPATILNASNKTNIKYKISGIRHEDINVVNSINTQHKLIDRLNKIKELGGTISFESIVDNIFEQNLKMIDTSMPNIVADVCLRAYTSKNKNLMELFNTSNLFENQIIAKKKLTDLLKGFSFDIKPGTIWNGDYDVNGGIMIVTRDGKLLVLDLIYHENEVEDYLINNTKLDSPSSTRYKMLELFEENNNIYFTLNLQIRYK